MAYGQPRRPLDSTSPATYVWLNKLNAFSEADQMLKDGTTIAMVCDFLLEQNPQVAVTRKALYERLRDYRRALPPLEAIRGHSSRLVMHVRNQIQGHVQELDELWGLYDLQLSRLERGIAAERQAGHPMKTVTKDVEVAAGILERLAKIKIALGVPDMVSDAAKSAASGMLPVVESRVSKLLADPEARRRAAELMDRMARLDPEKVSERLRLVQGGEGGG